MPQTGGLSHKHGFSRQPLSLGSPRSRLWSSWTPGAAARRVNCFIQIGLGHLFAAAIKAKPISILWASKAAPGNILQRNEDVFTNIFLHPSSRPEATQMVINQRMDHLGHICIREYYLAIERNEIPLHLATRLNLRLRLSERRRVQARACCEVLCIWDSRSGGIEIRMDTSGGRVVVLEGARGTFELGTLVYT